ncbi:MAG: peptide synthetase [Cellulosilyticum sp.]|nr:peptide synthetase [Cellulosilyticum sp.]
MEEVRIHEGKEIYPLTAAQRIFLYTLQTCPHKQVLNIGTSMLIGNDIEFDYLREAIKRTYERNEALRIQITKTPEGATYQYVAPVNTEQEIEYADFSEKTQAEVDEILRGWTAIPLDQYDKPLNRMVMLNTADNYRGIYFVVNHMTLDSAGIFAMLTDLVEIYCSLKYGLEYPKAMQSYIKALKKDLAYESDSPQRKKDALYWHQYYMQSEPIFTDVQGTARLQEERKEMNNPNLRAVRMKQTDLSADHEVFHLEPQPTRELLDYCESNRVPMVCLLIMGIRTYLSKQNNFEKDISIKSTVARRATVLEKKSGGTRVHFFPCRSIVEENQTFKEGIQVVQQSQNEIFKHANYDPVALLGELQELYGYEPGFTHECMSLTYQPLSFRSKDERLKGVDYKCKWYPNGMAGQALYLTVMHNSYDQGLDFYFEYQPSMVSKQQLQDMYYYMCKIIFLGVQNEEMTVGEILRTV